MSGLSAKIADSISPIYDPAWLYVTLAGLVLPVEKGMSVDGPIQPIYDPAWLYVPMAGLVLPVQYGPPPGQYSIRLLENGDMRITESGDTRILEQYVP